MAAIKLSNGLLHKNGQKIIVKIIRKQKNKIIDTVEKGYLLGEKVIRHAKVVVAN